MKASCVMTVSSIWFSLFLVGCFQTPQRELPAPESPIPLASSTPRAEYEPPTEEERLYAIGKEPCPLLLRVNSATEPLRPPGKDDWLTSHPEKRQTYRDYTRSFPNLPSEERNVIYLMPLGQFGKDDPSLKELRRYTKIFFGLEVKLLQSPAGLKPTSRRGWEGKIQWLTGDVLNQLEQVLPSDAYCLLGITMTDLYPGEGWNYVFGIAKLRQRVGVYSLARYDPAFFGEPRGDGWKLKALERSCKVLGHEIGHMLTMPHCVYNNCLMNGSNHLGELDEQSSFLCPVCLRKLEFAVKPDLAQRYAELKRFFLDNGLTPQAKWIEGVTR